MEIFIGIDQSINSSGITFNFFENDIKIDEKFYIITNKITKNEEKIQLEIPNFEYKIYNKIDKKETIDNNDFERSKLLNNIMISDIIIDLIQKSKNNSLDKIYVGMEGISFSSFQTKSLVDLSGLSYIIRYRLHNFFKNNQGGLYILTPAEVKLFASGNGSASKEIMVNLFKTIYHDFTKLKKIDDIADSYWICSYLKHYHDKNCLVV